MLPGNIEDCGILYSQESFSMQSPQMRKLQRKDKDEGALGITSQADLRKFKMQKGIIRKSVSMEEIQMFSREEEEDGLDQEDDMIMTADRMPVEGRFRNYNNMINKSQTKLMEEFSRNNRNTIINALIEPEDGVCSRNNFIPSFNVSGASSSSEE